MWPEVGRPGPRSSSWSRSPPGLPRSAPPVRAGPEAAPPELGTPRPSRCTGPAVSPRGAPAPLLLPPRPLLSLPFSPGLSPGLSPSPPRAFPEAGPHRVDVCVGFGGKGATQPPVSGDSCSQVGSLRLAFPPAPASAPLLRWERRRRGEAQPARTLLEPAPGPEGGLQGPRPQQCLLPCVGAAPGPGHPGGEQGRSCGCWRDAPSARQPAPPSSFHPERQPLAFINSKDEGGERTFLLFRTSSRLKALDRWKPGAEHAESVGPRALLCALHHLVAGTSGKNHLPFAHCPTCASFLNTNLDIGSE